MNERDEDWMFTDMPVGIAGDDWVFRMHAFTDVAVRNTLIWLDAFATLIFLMMAMVVLSTLWLLDQLFA